MPKHSHLTLQDRSIICVRINQGMSFAQIAEELEKAPSTISREVRLHRIPVAKGSYGRSFNPCVHRNDCKKTHVCDTCLCGGKRCRNCKDKQKCTLRKYEYQPNHADASYKDTLSESRKGLAIDPLELERINQIISPLVKNGQSIHHVLMNNADELMVSEKTAYNYLNAGLFDADKMDCPRIVRMRPRRAAPKLKIDRNCYEGRTYEDFTAFMADNPDVPVVQMDSVIGSKSGKVLLTMFFQNCNLLLAFLRDRNTARSVLEVFNDLYATLGRETYCKLFPVILTDRGSEFSNPVPIEQDENGELRSLVFYCNPSAPYQKGGIEVAHELIRRILPKGKSFDDLQQEDIDLMLSHINSYKRGKLNSRSAHQLFSFIYGDDILPKLNIREIEPNDIVLSPKLLKK